MKMEFSTWAKQKGLNDDVVAKLAEERMNDLDILVDTTEEDLRELSLKRGDFVALRRAVSGLKSERGSSVDSKSSRVKESSQNGVAEDMDGSTVDSRTNDARVNGPSSSRNGHNSNTAMAMISSGFAWVKSKIENAKKKPRKKDTDTASETRGGFRGMLQSAGTAMKSGFDNVSNYILGTGNGSLKKIEVRNGMNIYKLPVTVKDEDAKNKTRRCIIGSESVKRQQKTIMIVGATGSGKSTLIDGITNYIFDTKWEEPNRLQLIDLHNDEKKQKRKGEAESQTEWITVYTITDGNSNRLPYTLHLIDTPGFGDTRGISRDERLVAQIKALFENPRKYHIDKLDAVCFVAKAPDARLTHTQKYLFDSILAIFGNDIRDNILVMITFADGGKAPVLEAVKAAKLPHRRYFKFNNSALFANNGIAQSGEVVGIEGQSSASFAKMFWSMGEEALGEFFLFLKQLKPKSLTLTKEVLQQRENLQDTLKYLEQEVHLGLAKLDQLRVEEQIFNDNKQKIDDNKDFKYTVTEAKTEEVKCPMNQHVTHCLNCQNTCHDDCVYANDDEKAKCVAMGSNGHCERCTQRCHWRRHRNTGYIFKNTFVTVEKTYEGKLREYQKATGLAKEKINVMEMVRAEYLKIQIDTNKSVHQARQILMQLGNIALKPDPLSEVEYIEMLIKAEKSEHKPRWEGRVDELENIRKRAVRLQGLQNNDTVLPNLS